MTRQELLPCPWLAELTLTLLQEKMTHRLMGQADILCMNVLIMLQGFKHVHLYSQQAIPVVQQVGKRLQCLSPETQHSCRIQPMIRQSETLKALALLLAAGHQDAPQ